MASHLMLQRCLAAAPLTSETSPPRRRRLRRMAVDQPPQGSVGGLNCGPRSRTCAVCASHVCRPSAAAAATGSRRLRHEDVHHLISCWRSLAPDRRLAALLLSTARVTHFMWAEATTGLSANVACADLAQIRHVSMQRAPRLPCHQPHPMCSSGTWSLQLRHHLSPSCRRCRDFVLSRHGASPYGSTATCSDAVPRCCTVGSQSASIAARTHVAIRVR